MLATYMHHMCNNNLESKYKRKHGWTNLRLKWMAIVVFENLFNSLYKVQFRC